jgi:hypothetical protein
MVSINPDKHIRKAIHDLVNGIVVNTKTINSFDTRVTGSGAKNEYVLFTAQTKEVEKANKCDYRWTTSLLIEIYTKTSSAGNSGSRVLLNDIEQAIHTLLTPKLVVLGFETLTQNITYESQLETVTDTENIFRSFLRLNLTLI